MSKLENITLPRMPEFKVNSGKNGYELRTDILGMAKDLVASEFAYKWQGWEMTAVRDSKTGQVVTQVGMPDYPGLDAVLDAAQKMYDFVNNANIKK